MSQATTFNGRYEIHRRIARGGMADVYLARDQLLDRPVAVKVLFPQFAADPAFVARFRREAQAAANLNHPNIVNVYDWGQQDSTYFIVMEYVDGRSLADIVRAEGPLHPDRAADVTADIAAALGFAHRNGVVHRDVKPGNVLIAPSGQVKVTDFGIARAVDGADENLTQTGSVMGTATYFSPEQAQGLPLDPRSDLYSLGCVLYEMVVGRPPFPGDSPVAIAYKHVQERPAAPRQHNPNVPPDLEAIILQLLQKSPGQRYPSAEDLRADLRRFRQRQPVLAATGGTGTELVGYGATSVVPAAGMGATTAVPRTTRALPATEVEYYDDRYYREPRRTGLFIGVLIVLLLVLGGLLYLLARTLSGDDDPTVALVEVPRVIELTRSDAETVLRNAGFDVTVQQEKNDTVEAGIVFDQSPAAGERIEEGSAVTIKVSSGANTVPMPNVVGSDIEQARQTLTSLGFTTINEDVQPDDEAPPGQVTAQDPAPDTDVPKDVAITLTVSSGPERVEVPDVAGRTATEASNILGRAGFEVDPVSQASATVPEGTVIGTNPPAGTELDNGAQVQLIVSSGPAGVQVPNVLSKSEAEATAQLLAAGLKVDDSCEEVPDGSPNVGRVVEQTPSGGTTVDPGSTVEIVVGDTNC